MGEAPAVAETAVVGFHFPTKYPQFSGIAQLKLMSGPSVLKVKKEQDGAGFIFNDMLVKREKTLCHNGYKI